MNAVRAHRPVFQARPRAQGLDLAIQVERRACRSYMAACFGFDGWESLICDGLHFRAFIFVEKALFFTASILGFASWQNSLPLAKALFIQQYQPFPNAVTDA